MNFAATAGLEELKQKLLLLTYIYGYRSGRFVLTSGRESSYYIDGKQVTMSPEGLSCTAAFILSSLQRKRTAVDAVGGLTLGADPIAAAVTALSHDSRHGFSPVSCFIVRKEPKKHGTGARIEGPFFKGIRTVIVDDVLTTGASVLSAAAAVEAAGGVVGAVYLLVDRMEGGVEEIKRAGYTLEAIVTRLELEALQARMETRYPLLSARLQGEGSNWKEMPWDELAPCHPGLYPRLEQLGTKLARIRESGSGNRADLAGAAQGIWRAVKAAALHPRGESEALNLLEKLSSSLNI